MSLQRSIIVDNDFLKFSEKLRINTNIKVFARISPENKAAIIRKIKDEIEKVRRAIPRGQRIFAD
jgi:magnesium-transporting ATPase (P-type)